MTKSPVFKRRNPFSGERGLVKKKYLYFVEKIVFEHHLTLITQIITFKGESN